jgi:hypothetical protein
MPLVKQMTPAKKKAIAILVPIEIVSAILAMRDLARRSDLEIRGSKRFWRIFMLMNPGNSLFYWVAGRRPVNASPGGPTA